MKEFMWGFCVVLAVGAGVLFGCWKWMDRLERRVASGVAWQR